MSSEAVDNPVNNPANSDNLDHVEVLRREIAETALNDTNNTSPFDYVDGEEEYQGSISDTEANQILYGDLINVRADQAGLPLVPLGRNELASRANASWTYVTPMLLKRASSADCRTESSPV